MDHSKFNQLISEGKYKKIHEEIDKEITQQPSRDNCIIKISTLLHEGEYVKALNFVQEYETYFSSYAKGVVYYNVKKYNDAINYMNDYLSQHDCSFEIQAKLVLLNSYLLDNTSDITQFPLLSDVRIIINDLEKEYSNHKEKFYRRMFFLLIKAFLKAKNPSSPLKEDLIQYFNNSSDFRFKVFNEIIKYSSVLNYEPEFLIPSFLESTFIEGDGYFCYLLEGQDFTEEEKKILRRIWFWEYLILTQLIITNDAEVKEISHYTSIETFEKMSKDENNSFIRLVSLAAANDKIEGNVLPLLFFNNIPKIIFDSKNENRYIAMQTSYSRNKNSLTMFRLYGKKDNKEGTGVSLIFNKKFFATDFSTMHFEKFFSGEGTASEKKDYRQPLAWILYYDKNKNMLYYYPNEDDLEPTKISLDIQKPKWNSYPSSKSKQKEKNLEYSFHKLLSEMKKLKSKEMQKTGMKILYKLRYFIKLSDFAEEKELRVLQLIDPTDKAIEDDGEKLYSDYLNIWAHDSLHAVVFGPKAISAAQYELYENRLWENHPDVSLEISDAPLA
jgi:hypothetical protein